MAHDAKKAEALRRRPLSDAALELLATMQDDGMLLLMPSTMQRHKPSLYSTRTLKSKHGDDLPFPLSDAAVESLRKRGYIAQANKARVEEKLRRVGEQIGSEAPLRYGERGSYLAWYDVPYFVTDDGRAALDGLRDRLAEIRAARELAETLPRLLVVGRFDHNGRRQPGVGGVYRIVRETEGRYYVDDVESGKRAVGYDPVVKGGKPQRYVEKEHVAAVDVTPEQHAAMRRVTREYDESVTRASAQMEEELAPIRLRYAQRREQLVAQLEDEMREALEGPKPGGPRR